MTSLESMRTVARRLSPLNISFAFVGGAALCVLVDKPELMDLRPTLDVDVVVSAVSYVQYSELEAALRKAGFRHDQSKDAPICRWIVDGCKVDIMPQQSGFLGMNSKWFAEVMASATPIDLGEGCIAKVITPACFLATKLEAFSDRGRPGHSSSGWPRSDVSSRQRQATWRYTSREASAWPRHRPVWAYACWRLAN